LHGLKRDGGVVGDDVDLEAEVARQAFVRIEPVRHHLRRRAIVVRETEAQQPVGLRQCAHRPRCRIADGCHGSRPAVNNR
jgi:hypothetical protein